MGGIFEAALREHEFDEVERILRRNQQALEQLPPRAASLLFSPAMVHALVQSHSMVHLELLADMKFVRSLENRLGAVDVVVRELLGHESSPLLSAVVARWGGVEHLTYSESERELMKRTFANPEWYVASNAHYPLIISAVEALGSGRLDVDYNHVDRNYEATQGISRRSRCPVYLAVKTEVLSIEAGLEQQVEADFCVSDLWEIFTAVQERSRFDKRVWEDLLCNDEHPTPYAYLLYEISADLHDLSAKAVCIATGDGKASYTEAPGRIARDLARMWALCVSSIANSQGEVSSGFRDNIIRQYLLFVLALGWEPSEVHPALDRRAEGLDPWRDLFSSELRRQFVAGNSRAKAAIKEAFNSLDQGKMYVFNGRDWLESQLFGVRSAK